MDKRRFLRSLKDDVFLLLLCSAVWLVVILLYHLPWEAVIYPTVLCLVVLLLAGYFRYVRSRKKHEKLEWLAEIPDTLMEELKEYDSPEDEDYRALIQALVNLKEKQEQEFWRKERDSVDYYTTWVHQIKTPIAAMRLRLEEEDSILSAQLKMELLRVEQYVEMVLTYMRLQSETTDFVFREYPLDKMIRASVRRFAPQFIHSGIRLEMDLDSLDRAVLTDEKWFCFVLEQILSNALKYTREGSVRIWLRERDRLCIRDTGIGIAPEDLPRIFERGYTGQNGRVEKRSSGLGLYLCRSICDRLGFVIRAESEAGAGTTIILELEQNKRLHE